MGGADGPGTVHDEDQGRSAAGAQILGVDRRIHPVLTEHVPADVDLQGRVRRVRPHHRAQEVLLMVFPRAHPVRHDMSVTGRVGWRGTGSACSLQGSQPAYVLVRIRGSANSDLSSQGATKK